MFASIHRGKAPVIKPAMAHLPVKRETPVVVLACMPFGSPAQDAAKHCRKVQQPAVNVLDLILITQHFNETGTAGWIRQDVNGDGIINVLDCIIVGQHWTG